MMPGTRMWLGNQSDNNDASDQDDWTPLLNRKAHLLRRIGTPLMSKEMTCKEIGVSSRHRASFFLPNCRSTCAAVQSVIAH